MAAIEHYWAIIGGPHSSAFMIQCKLENEARWVAGTLQGIVNSLPHGADHTQILTTFDIPSVQTLLEDEAGFYVIMIGSPPSIHHTVESAKHVEGSFKYPICRHTPSFWLALAFVIVKGIPQHMPPLEIIVEVPESPIDTLGKQLHDSLHISPQTPQIASAFTSHASSSATSTSSTRLETAMSDTEPSPIIYSHVHNLHGIISSHYYPTSMMPVWTLACPLSTLTSHYLASHGYGAEDVNLIIEVYRNAHTSEQFITLLAKQGMAINEAKFFQDLIDLHNRHDI
ncbi:hypothetical protein F5J12DRAFT_786787 [Pisolithus orientalis]|uniref:uncharacterized protein n=1 Tax=Pisolithus orientalis TaxID=936130 RepID=UPI0022250391|nr:uncharacterized protein F5J12DRAFT_786787 [Pisolithus orientalis]KAI5988850.1 hypothetical protein F5J12DRAFT_786787 [Pisolithus orientalis]